MTRRLRTVLGMALALALTATVAPLATPTALVAEPGLAAWKVVDLHLPTNDVAYDATRNRYLATVDATDYAFGNELVELDPLTGAVSRHVPVGSQPHDVALSSDGTTAYVALSGANRIAQVDLATFTLTRSFSTGDDPRSPGLAFPEQLTVPPGQPDVVVASLKRTDLSPRFVGVVAFRDGVALTDRISAGQPHNLLVNAIEAVDATHLVGTDLETTDRAVVHLTLDGTGVHLASIDHPDWGGQDFEAAGGRLYVSEGEVIDPTGAGGDSVVRHDDVYRGGSGYLVEPLPSIRREAYLDGRDFSVVGEDGTVQRQTFSNLPLFPTDLTASRDGFAVASTWGLFLLGPNVGPDQLMRPAPLANHLDDLVLQGTDHRVTDAVQDPVRSQLYLAVSSYLAPDRADRIDAIDPATGDVVRSVPLPAQPTALAVSDDGAVLYVGFRGASRAQVGRVRLDLPVLALTDLVTLARPVGSPEPWNGTWVRDLSVRPGHPDTVAAAMLDEPAIVLRGVQQVITDYFGSQIAFTDAGHAWGVEDYGGLVGLELREDGSVVRLPSSPMTMYGALTSGGGRLFVGGKVIDVTDPLHPSLVADLGSTFDQLAVLADGTRAFTAGTGDVTEHDLARARAIHTETFGSYNADGLVATSDGLAVLQSVTAPGGGLELELMLLRHPHQPTITNLSGNHGAASGATQLYIQGTELSRVRSVRFDGTEVEFVPVNDLTLRVVATPAHSPGTVDVTVTSSGGTSVPSEHSRFTFDREAAFAPYGPARLLDTRTMHPAYVPAPGVVVQTAAPFAKGYGYEGDAAAVWLSVTAIGGPTPGYLTVWSCDQPRPPTSSVNTTEPNQIVANLVLSELGPSRRICVYTSQAADVLVDLAGSTPKVTGYHPVTPARLLDSRTAVGGAVPAAGSITRVQVAGRAGVPRTGVGAVAVNVTATGSRGAGWVTAWSCDTARPRSSTLNLDRAGQTVANFAISDIGPTGALCLYTSGGADLIVDVVGWWETGVLRPEAPTRIFDTRPGPEHLGSVSVLPGNVVEVRLTDHTDVPPGQWAGAILNVTVTNTYRPGYVTVFPRGEQPATSNLNVIRPGQTVAVAVVVGATGDDDRFYVYTDGGADLVIDVLAWIPKVDPPASAT